MSAYSKSGSSPPPSDPVSVPEFVHALEQHWLAYGNVTSAALRAAWADVCRVFNSQITSPSDRWPVIPAELGVGKTLAAKLYCSMLPTPGPGVLAVVRTRDQADEVARDINAWAGSDQRAMAYHSKLAYAQRQDLAALAAYPVIVICHEAYERGLGGKTVSADKLDQMLAYRGGRRTLAIVDESLDLVHESRVSRGALSTLYRLIPHSVQKHHVLAFDVLNAYGRALRVAPDDRHQALPSDTLMAGFPGRLTVDDADRVIADLEKDVKHSTKLKSDDRADACDVLGALRAHFARYRWTSGDGARTAISGHRLLLMPPGTHGVVLDATARLNNVYLHRPDQFEIVTTTPARNYSSVTLHVARVGDTGKASAVKGGASGAQTVLGAVVDTVGDASKRRVLVVTHKAVEDLNVYQAEGAKLGFKAFDVAHWNKLDGRNDWKDFDTLVVASLPYWPVSTAMNTYMAVKGVEMSTDELNAPPAEVRAIRETTIAAQVAQAVGRIRLRTMTRGDGGCDPCDVFLRLPNSGLQRLSPDNVLDQVVSVLPGIRVFDWSGQSQRLSRAVDAVGAAFLAYAREMQPGAWEKVSDIRDRIGATKHMTWFRVQRDPKTRAGLAALGARIEPRVGRRAARLIRLAQDHQVDVPAPPPSIGGDWGDLIDKSARAVHVPGGTSFYGSQVRLPR